MKRLFISQHPVFFASANTLNVKRIEKSNYFWWWYALLSSDKYIALCETKGAASGVDAALLKVYADFGDVRVKSGETLHAAFKRWWTEKVNVDETRGEYLFAEKLTGNKVEILTEETAFEEAIDADKVVISIPKHISRSRIDSAIERILKKHFSFERGRLTRKPANSTARYHLNKTFDTDVMKLAFACYEERKHADDNGYKITNKEIAEEVGLVVKTKRKDEEIDAYEQSRTVSVKTTRYITMAQKAIINAENGQFG